MFLDLTWQSIPDVFPERGPYPDPFKPETVLLCVNQTVFEGLWIRKGHPDFDVNYAKRLGMPGYWQDMAGGQYPGYRPIGWASVTELQSKYTKKLHNVVKEGLPEGKKLITLTPVPEWVEIRYDESEKVWKDIFGRKLPETNKKELRVFVEIPLWLSKEAKIVGPTESVWN